MAVYWTSSTAPNRQSCVSLPNSEFESDALRLGRGRGCKPRRYSEWLRSRTWRNSRNMRLSTTGSRRMVLLGIAIIALLILSTNLRLIQVSAIINPVNPWRTSVGGISAEDDLLVRAGLRLHEAQQALSPPPSSAAYTHSSSKAAHDERSHGDAIATAEEDRPTTSRVVLRTSGRQSVDTMSTVQLRTWVAEENERQQVVNVEQLPTPRADQLLVIVIQVHRKLQFLRLLISSLGEAAQMHSVLLIISADHVSEELLALVNSINFCRVLPIFFPYSMQLYPNTFPGQDPRDCASRISRQEAEQRKCQNAHTPDMYGHYREAKFTATKHHWWWKLWFTFSKVRVLADYSGWVVTVEEDHILAPDFVHVIRKLDEMTKRVPVDFLGLGRHKLYPMSSFIDEAQRDVFDSPRNNMGLALNRQAWQALLKCTEAFCTYDDYNWDWSLQYISSSCHSQRWLMLVMTFPRVFHVGNCGIHQGDKECKPIEAALEVSRILELHRRRFFPKELRYNDVIIGGVQSPPNGGWGDPRDHRLCRQIANGTVTLVEQ